MKSAILVAGAAMALMALASPASALTTWTLSDDTNTGFFGGATASGTFTTGTAVETSDITVVEFPGTSTEYTYTLSGPYDGPGWIQTSQMPPPACIFGPPCPGVGAAFFHLGLFSGPGQVDTDFGDTGEDFSGVGTLTAVTSAPEPATWAMLLLGFGGLGALMRSARRKSALAD